MQITDTLNAFEIAAVMISTLFFVGVAVAGLYYCWGDCAPRQNRKRSEAEKLAKRGTIKRVL